MKHLVLISILLVALCASAQATDITIAANQIPDFHPTGLDAAITGTATVTNNSATVTSSALFRQSWVDNYYTGFIINLAGVNYYVDNVATTSSLTLKTVYAGSSGSASFTIYPFVLLRFYADQYFTVSDGSYIVQQGTVGKGNFFRQYACSVIGTTLYLPTVTLPSTTDALNPSERSASYIASFYLLNGSPIKRYDCFNRFQLIPDNTSTTWTTICTNNTPVSNIPAVNQFYTTTQVNGLLNGLCGTTCANYVLGSATSLSGHNFTLQVSNETNKPALRYNGTTGHWQYSNDGLSFANLDFTSVFSLNGQVGPVTLAVSTTTTSPAIAASGGVLTLSLPPIQSDGADQIFWSRDAGSPIFSVRGYGAGVSAYGEIDLYRARGTAASPSAVQSNDVLGRVSFKGLTNGSNFAGGALIYAITAENWSSTARGADLYFNVGKNGSSGQAFDRLIIMNDGQIRYPGETSGYVSFKPKAAASSTKYTWPDAPTTGQLWYASSVSGADVQLGWTNAPTLTTVNYTTSLLGPRQQVYSTSIALPATIGDSIDFATVTYVNAAIFKVSVTSATGASFTVAKTYTFALRPSIHGTTAYKVASPIASTGADAGGDDFAIDVKETSGIMRLRVRRTAGSASGNLDINFVYEGGTDDGSFSVAVPSNVATYSDVPTTYTPSAPLSLAGGGLSINGGATITKLLSATASLDFGATAAGTCDSLTVSISGAADGDPVILGIPNALAASDTYQSFYGFVSSSGVVTVKRCNLTNATTALSNPSAATVRVTVLHF
jgi:hypothetical protein